MIDICRTQATHPDFTRLVDLLNQELKTYDGDDHEFYMQYNGSDALLGVVLAYSDDRLAGCGAFKEYNEETAEVKRMFVLPECRGRRVAAAILLELEVWAKELDKERCILETGRVQHAAVRLYERSGYQEIPNYDPYVGMHKSVCYEKIL